MASTPLPELPGNSKLPRAQQPPTADGRPKVEKLISGNVVIKKKSIWSRIGESFTGDNAGNVGQYVLLDVMLPAFKTMLSEAMTQGVERMLFGDGRPRSRGGSSYGPYSQHTPYNQYSRTAQRPPWEEDRQMSRQGRANHDFREIILPNRIEANLVLDSMVTLVDKYGSVRVSDFYNAVGMSSEYTDEKYGWTNLHDAQIMHVSQGYLIQMPTPIVL